MPETSGYSRGVGIIVEVNGCKNICISLGTWREQGSPLSAQSIVCEGRVRVVGMFWKFGTAARLKSALEINVATCEPSPICS